MKLKNISFLISLLLLTISTPSPAADDLSDAGTGTFSTNQTKRTVPTSQYQEEKPEELPLIPKEADELEMSPMDDIEMPSMMGDEGEDEPDVADLKIFSKGEDMEDAGDELEYEGDELEDEGEDMEDEAIEDEDDLDMDIDFSELDGLGDEDEEDEEDEV